MRGLVICVALSLFASPALAQTVPAGESVASPPSACAALTVPPPSLPDGARADNDAMTAGNAAFLAWAQPQQQALACRRAEIEAVRARWQALSTEYNSGAQALNTANAAWDAELAQYNGRAGGRRTASNH